MSVFPVCATVNSGVQPSSHRHQASTFKQQCGLRAWLGILVAIETKWLATRRDFRQGRGQGTDSKRLPHLRSQPARLGRLARGRLDRLAVAVRHGLGGAHRRQSPPSGPQRFALSLSLSLLLPCLTREPDKSAQFGTTMDS